MKIRLSLFYMIGSLFIIIISGGRIEGLIFGTLWIIIAYLEEISTKMGDKNE